MLFFGWICVLVSWLSPKEVRAFRLNGLAQGTTYSVTYYATDSVLTEGSVDSLVRVIDQSMSIYKPGSLISQFNASKKGICVDDHFAVVVDKALYVYRESGGEFDITVAPLVRAWGFGPKKVSSMPDSAVIKDILKFTGSDKLNKKGNCLKKKVRQLQLDVNGIAQGYTVDQVAGLLEKRAVYYYMVELGGEIRVKGKKTPSGELFKIGVESPSQNNDEAIMQRSVSIADGGITTSGNYRKFYTNGNRKISHLISPKTGYPLQNEMISATVISKDAFTSDAFDNVFMALGIKRSFEYLKKDRTMEALFIYQKADGSVADTATAGFYNFVPKK